MQQLHEIMVTMSYHTSEYRPFQIHEKGKTRDVVDLPYFPDRLVHRLVVNGMHDMLMANLIPQTYAALPGRGAHQA